MSVNPQKDHFFTRLICLLAIAGLIGCAQPDFLTSSRDAPAPFEDAPLRQERLPIPASGMITVNEGDDLYKIATRYHVTPQSIIRDNDLEAPFILSPGNSLTLSPVRFHIVTYDDNIYSLSQRYAVSQYQLAQLNDLAEPFELVLGQRLILPESLDFSVLDLEDLVVTTAPKPVPPKNKNPSVKTLNPPKAPKAPVNAFVTPVPGSTGFTWPIKGEVIEEFGPIARGVHNDGMNIKAPLGTLIATSAPGVVAYVGTNLKSFGTLVLVKHEGGFMTAYAHLDQIIIEEGDVLGSGAPIGQIGMAGRVDSPQLHFEIRRSRTPINPREVIS